MLKKTDFSVVCVLFGALLVGLLLSSCGPKKKTVAELRAEKRANDSISLLQQEQSLVYYDSLLTDLLPTIDPMLKQFRFEHQTEYEDHGHYVHRLLQTTGNTARNYLQAYVSDDRRTTVRAYYYGAGPLHLHELTISADSVMVSFRGATHSFEAEGWHETLSLETDDALQLLQFINAYYTFRIRVSLVGTKTKQVFYLSDNDKTALMETYRLGVLFNDVHQLEQQVRQTSLQIEKYQKRLEK